MQFLKRDLRVISSFFRDSKFHGLISLPIIHFTRKAPHYLTLEEQTFCLRGVLKSVIDVKKAVTTEEWNMLESCSSFNRSSFKYQVSRYLLIESQSRETSRNFIEYCLSGGDELSLLTKASLCKLMGSVENGVTKEYAEFIDSVCNEALKSEFQSVKYVFSRILYGLHLSPNWKKNGLQIISRLPDDPFPAEEYSNFAFSALMNGDIDVGMKYIQLIFDNGHTPGTPCLIKLIKVSTDSIGKKKKQNTIFKLLKNYETIGRYIYYKVGESLKDYFENETDSWVARFSKMDEKNRCQCCGTSVTSSPITKNEYEILKRVILDTFNNDKYGFHSSPEEIKRFTKFMNEVEPFTVVLDGLNVICSAGFNSHQRMQRLDQVISLLIKRGERVLFIGKDHLKHNYSYSLRHIQYFLLNDQSTDDIFTLWAALWQNKKTYFVTNDFMGIFRSKVTVDDNIVRLFWKWRLQHQILMESLPYQKFSLVYPSRIAEYHRDEAGKCQHIPLQYSLNTDFPKPANFTNWLCLRSVGRVKKKAAAELWPDDVDVDDSLPTGEREVFFKLRQVKGRSRI